MNETVEDENDPVVYERTVLLSRKLCSHLLLMQYPVRSAERTYDKAHITATRVKHRQQSVELELALDTRSCHYSVTGAKDAGCSDKQVQRQLDNRSCVSSYNLLLNIDGLSCWGLSAGYQPRPQVVDRGTTARYGGQLRYI